MNDTTFSGNGKVSFIPVITGANPKPITNADRVFTLETGWKVHAPENCCLFCDHCTDIFYDTGGIYHTFCNIGKDIYTGSRGECPDFIEDKEGDE